MTRTSDNNLLLLGSLREYDIDYEISTPRILRLQNM